MWKRGSLLTNRRIEHSAVSEENGNDPENAVPLPDNIKPYISTLLAWDNINRLEETLSGGRTSHRVNGIAIPARHLGPDLLPAQVTPVITKSKQRGPEVVRECNIPTYNAGECCGPPPRSYVEVSSTEIQRNASKKNLLWILVQLHAAEKQKVCGWTGFHILVRDEIEVKKDNIGYLPTIDAPAMNMSTVFEILNQSLKIKDTLKLQAIIVVSDQALYVKATEIKWKHTERFGSILLRMGAFHTICIFLGIMGKRFQDAGLKDICIESGVITEGSVGGVFERRRYNRAVRFHKLMYKALMRVAWPGFQHWLEENQQSKKRAVHDAFNGLVSLYDKICKAEIEDKLRS